jgi:hypothetical protein
MNPQTIRSSNRDVDNRPPGPFQDCRDVIHLAFFFDGTGNNMEADAPQRKWSNIARLFMSARLKPEQGIYPIYIAGVGTRFNGDVGALRSAWTWVQDNSLGNMGGFGGDQRLAFGEEQMSDSLRRALLMLAQQTNSHLKKYAEANQDKSFAELNKALGKHRLIKCINISVFGFSRGAALARAFVNRLAAQFKPGDGGGHTLQGYPVRMAFLGVFDTVASFGLPRQNLTLPWSERDLRVPGPQLLERCVHFVAAHELRFSFPLDLVREAGRYHGNAVEKVYPGVHSDVGGGYEPDKQARSDNLARVPLCDMQPLAVESGVRLNTLQQLENDNFPIFQRFEILPETKSAYAAYRAAAGAGSGTIESQLRRHMELFYAAQGTMHRASASSASDAANEQRVVAAREKFQQAQQAANRWVRRNPTSKAEAEQMSADYARYRETQAELAAALKDVQRLDTGKDDIAAEARALERAVEDGQVFTATKGRLMITLTAHRWMLDAWRRSAPKAVCDFFSRYVHDSRTDFVGGAEPFAYFNDRGVYEQTRPVSQSLHTDDADAAIEQQRRAARARDRERAGISNYKEP